MKFGVHNDAEVYVDNFVDKRILILGKVSLNSWYRPIVGQPAKLFPFKINSLQNPRPGRRETVFFFSAVHK
jgi:hypothetical protein